MRIRWDELSVCCRCANSCSLASHASVLAPAQHLPSQDIPPPAEAPRPSPSLSAPATARGETENDDDGVREAGRREGQAGVKPSPESQAQPAEQDASKTLELDEATAASASKSNLDFDPSSRAYYLGDLRIRNPVPSKLKSKMKEKDGNFSVMHMDVKKTILDARDLAAKRTSELTQAAAIEASKNGYQPIRRSKMAWQPLAPAPRDDHGSPQVLPPEVARAEQERLLTLIQSLHPSLVVDQLCRALAYFGGMPAPLPTTEPVFPNSDRMNGNGRNFIGWLAEIFPPMDLANLPGPAWVAVLAQEAAQPSSSRPPEQITPDAPAAVAAAATAPREEDQAPVDGPSGPPKRRRGRPKGSKSTKPRKDKGYKKGEHVPADGPTGAEAETQPPQPYRPVPSSQLVTTSQPAPSSQPANPPQNLGFAHTRGTEPESSPITTPSGKKRGRPKGSKNRPKPQRHEGNVPSEAPSPDPNLRLVQPRPSQQQGASQSDMSPNARSRAPTALEKHAQSWAAQPSHEETQTSQSTNPSQSSSPAKKKKKRKPSMQLTQNNSPVSSRPTSVSPTLQRSDQQMAQRDTGSSKRRRLTGDQGQPIGSGNTHPNPSPAEAALSTLPSPSTTSSAGVAHNSPSATQTATQQPSLLMRRGQQWTQQQQYMQMQQQQQKRAQLMARHAASQDFRDEAQPVNVQPSSSGPFLNPSQDPQRAAAWAAQRKAHGQQMHQQQKQPSLPYSSEHSAGPFPPQSSSGAPGYVQAAPTASAQNGTAPTSSSMGISPSAYSGSFSDSAYLGMQYALGASRAVSSSNLYGTQLGQDQLETTLAQTDIPNRMYDSFGRRA